MEQHLLFGSENAEADQLLFDCKIDKTKPSEAKQIITGRWGTGKTAIIFLQNENLINELNAINPEYKNIWYLSEGRLNFKKITEIYYESQNQNYYFESLMAEFWKIEIIRIYCLLLYILRDKFQHFHGAHWNRVFHLAKTRNLRKSVSEYMTPLVNILHPTKNVYSDINEITIQLSELVDNETYRSVKKCLQDLKNNGEEVPTVAIEPIETPVSSIEHSETGLASKVVTSLLNIFKDEFEPGKTPFNLRLVIPWHRFPNTETAFPQKIDQYVGKVSWTRNTLREFICKRIAWEFRRVGRNYSLKGGQDEWDILFEKQVENISFNPPIIENSFDYLLRHTHYRNREIQSIARKCIEDIFDEDNGLDFQNEDEFLRKGKITSYDIKRTIHKHNESYANLLIEEAARRFPEINQIINSLNKIEIPFSLNDLSRRINKNDLNISLDKIVDILWDSGVLGITAIVKNNLDSKKLDELFSKKGKYDFRDKKGHLYERWTWFFYNIDFTSPNSIINRLERIENDIEYGFVLHPKTFEKFSPKMKTENNAPVGI